MYKMIHVNSIIFLLIELRRSEQYARGKKVIGLLVYSIVNVKGKSMIKTAQNIGYTN